MNLQNLPSSNSSKFLVRLLILISSVAILYFGSQFLIPLVYGGMIALLVLPIVNLLSKKGWNDFLAIGATMCIILLVFTMVVGLLVWQSAEISASTPEMKDRFEEIKTDIFLYVETNLNIPKKTQEYKLNQSLENIEASAVSFTKKLIGVLSDWFLTFVYIIILLIERKRFKYFILQLIDSKHDDKAVQTMKEIAQTVKDYLYGQLLVTIVLGVIYMIGFSIIGIKFGIVLAIIAAILTFIPYLGNIIGGVLVVSIGLVSGISVQSIIFTILFLFVVQVLESYILKPWIIGNEISLNIFAVIVSVVVFTLIWGVSGSIIALPLTSIFRIVFSKIKPLQPYEYLLSDRKL